MKQIVLSQFSHQSSSFPHRANMTVYSALLKRGTNVVLGYICV